MDDIRIYNLALPPSEVSKLFLVGYDYCGDFDRNGYIDADDLDVFESCASGPAIPYAGACAEADFNKASDVDQKDSGILQQCDDRLDLVTNPAC